MFYLAEQRNLLTTLPWQTSEGTQARLKANYTKKLILPSKCYRFHNEHVPGAFSCTSQLTKILDHFLGGGSMSFRQRNLEFWIKLS